MNRLSYFVLSVLFIVGSPVYAENENGSGVRNIIEQETVLADGGVTMSREEFEEVIKYWTPEMRQAAANDVGDRFELISLSMATKKIAKAADDLSSDKDGDWYWKKEFIKRNALRDFMVDRHAEELLIPDMSEVAKEYYKAHKEDLNKRLEQRLSSHILFRCDDADNDCSETTLKRDAQQAFAELKAGSDFGEVAKKYSADVGTASKGGLFDKWLTLETPRVSPAYLVALFDLKNVGDVSEPVSSRFGLHIIRFDEQKLSETPSFEKVKGLIISDFVYKYQKQMAMEFDRKYRFSNDGFIDGKAMEEIFAPYKTEDPKPPVEKARPVEPAVVTE